MVRAGLSPPWSLISDLLPQRGLTTACMVGATLAVALNPCPAVVGDLGGGMFDWLYTHNYWSLISALGANPQFLLEPLVVSPV